MCKVLIINNKYISLNFHAKFISNIFSRIRINTLINDIYIY